MAAGAIVEDGTWLDRLHGELRGLLAPVFAQARSRLAALASTGGEHARTADLLSNVVNAVAAGCRTELALHG